MDDLVNLVAVNWKRAWNRAGVPIINEEDASRWVDNAKLYNSSIRFGRLLKTYIKEAVVVGSTVCVGLLCSSVSRKLKSM